MRLHITLGYPVEGEPECLYSGSDGEKAAAVMSAPGSEKYVRFAMIRNPVSIRKNNGNYKPPVAEPEPPVAEPEPEEPKRGRK